MKRTRIITIGLIAIQQLFFPWIRISSQSLNEATFLTRCEQFDKAESMLETLRKKNPSDSRIYFFSGENYLKEYFADTIANSLSEMAEKASGLFRKGCHVNPKDPLNFIGLSRIAYYTGQSDSSEFWRRKAKSLLLPYKKITKTTPPPKEYAFALAKIAESFIKDNTVDTSLSLPLIREALKIDDRNRDIYLIAGDIYLLVFDASSAIRYYNMAQENDPFSPTASMKIGHIYALGRFSSAAIPYFESAIQLDSTFAPAYRELGQLYSTSGSFDKSQQYFKKYLELTKGNIPAQIRYITSLFYAKEYEKVVRNVEEIFAYDKSRVYLNRIAGYSCYEMNPPDYEKAMTYMDTLFSQVSPDRIIRKDYQYFARILLKKNQNYGNLSKDLSEKINMLKTKEDLLPKAGSSERVQIKRTIDSLKKSVDEVSERIKHADAEIDKAFLMFDKLLESNPADKAILDEMAVNYYRFARYQKAGLTWLSMIGPGFESEDNYMLPGKAFYIAEDYVRADSVFRLVTEKFPLFPDGYLYLSRVNAKVDPDFKSDKASRIFEILLNITREDSVKNSSYISEACNYLGFYYLTKSEFEKARNYYRRIINLDKGNMENIISGYNGLGAVDIRLAGSEKSIDRKLAVLADALEMYKRILAMDPGNEAAKGSLSYIREYQVLVRKGINPNEIRGKIRDTDGRPVQYASVRVKDTAAETYTNASGEYKFEIPGESDELIITSDRFKSINVKITKKVRVYDIVLEQK